MARRHEPEIRQALAVAWEVGLRGDAPVGAAVLGPDGSLTGVGGNGRELTGDPTAHAEVVAIRRVVKVPDRWWLTGYTLVVTLEPCTMYAGVIVATRIDHLMSGTFDDKAGAVASPFDVLRDPRFNHRPRVISEVLETDCAALLEEFFEGRRWGPDGKRPSSRRPLAFPTETLALRTNAGATAQVDDRKAGES